MSKTKQYVSRRYLREKWDKLKWDIEKVIGVYDDGDDNVVENAQRVANEVIYFIGAIAKEMGYALIPNDKRKDEVEE